MNKRAIVIIGGGGHAAVVVDILKKQRREIKAIISPEDISERSIFDGITHLSSDDDISRFDPNDVELVNAIGSSPHSFLRRRINEKYIDKGYRFAKVIADDAHISEYAQIKEGVQILTRAVVHPGAIIGAHSIINTGAVIEHDCIIGGYNFIAPQATLCGQVITSENVFIGAGATVIPNIRVDGIVAAGAVLVTDLAANKMCYPSRSIIK